MALEMYIQVGTITEPVNNRRSQPPTKEDEGRFVRLHSVVEVASRDGRFLAFYGVFVDANGIEIPDAWVRVYEQELHTSDGVVVFTKDLL